MNMGIHSGIPKLWMAAFVSLAIATTPLSAQQNRPTSDDADLQARYEQAMASGDRTVALEHVLKYAEENYGENDPQTVKLTRHYGHALYQDHRYREATEVLKTALERSTAAFGPAGGEAFEINMNIAFAYSQWNSRLLTRMQYFDRALEILRERGERVSITYVDTLISIVVNLMASNAMEGSYTSHLSDTMYSEQAAEISFPIESEYYSQYGKAERYMNEAIEVAKELEVEDEYISAKVAIANARLQVAKTADLAAVPQGVQGYISRGTERDYYDEEQERLVTAIDKLSENPELNASYLHAANKALLEIAWLDKDKDRMYAMCTEGVLNSADEYAPDRLYEVSDNGTVFAPELGIPVSKNLFRRRVSNKKPQVDEYGNPVKKPYFIPVCVDGRLMAALVNAPRVTVEELGERRP
jgi:tetratricopeptide (TPR) repeat protein